MFPRSECAVVLRPTLASPATTRVPASIASLCILYNVINKTVYRELNMAA